jgi:hypothetical protein
MAALFSSHLVSAEDVVMRLFAAQYSMRRVPERFVLFSNTLVLNQPAKAEGDVTRGFRTTSTLNALNSGYGVLAVEGWGQGGMMSCLL